MARASVSDLLYLLRPAAALWEAGESRGVSDNHGTTASLERLLELIWLYKLHPNVGHKDGKKARDTLPWSNEAKLARATGGKVRREHDPPRRAFAREIATMVLLGASDTTLLAHIAGHYRVVMISKEEQERLDKIDRVGLYPDRLQRAGVRFSGVTASLPTIVQRPAATPTPALPVP